MQFWIIEPYDGLLVRDGRPFQSVPGSRAYTQPMAMPSVVAGGLRTQCGLDQGGDFGALKDDLLNQGVQGPFLVELNPADGKAVVGLWLPAPADAQWSRSAVKAPAGPSDELFRATPLAPDAAAEGSLRPLAPAVSATGPTKKLPTEPPRWWRSERLLAWLADPQPTDVAWKEEGLAGLVVETRTHVALDPATYAADEGMLFQTQMLRFDAVRLATQPEKIEERRMAMGVWSTIDCPERIAPLGGERKLMAWRHGGYEQPAPPAGLLEAIAREGRCRLYLLTPLIWDAAVPAIEGATVVAMANERGGLQAGWDLLNNRSKPQRGLLPAGSVLFVELAGDEATRLAWLKAHWWNVVNAESQEARDGFGIVAMGRWPMVEGAGA